MIGGEPRPQAIEVAQSPNKKACTDQQQQRQRYLNADSILRREMPLAEAAPDLSLSESVISVREPRRAGRSPKTSEVRRLAPKTKASTRPSGMGETTNSADASAGRQMRSRTRSVRKASANPMIVPAAERGRLSVSNWRTMRARPTPIARRTIRRRRGPREFRLLNLHFENAMHERL